MKPTIGRMVIYHTTEQDRQAMRDQRFNVADKLPAVVVACWGEGETPAVNLNVLLDGNGTLWVTSAAYGDTERCWSWPVIEK